MTTKIGGVLITLDVDAAGMSKFGSAASSVALHSSRMRTTAVSAGNEIAASFNKAGSAAAILTGHLGGFGARLRGVSQVLGSVNTSVAALGVGLAGGAVGMAAFLSKADGMRRMENNLRTVTTGSANLRDVQKELFEISQRSRAAQEGTVTLYSRMSRAAEGLGYSQQKLARITETVQKSFAIGGATSAEASGAAIQLAQGIASNRFSGDEFRSVSENAPVLLRAMAEQLGVNIGKLREMAHAGELTGEVVMKAILGASEVIDKQFGKTISTVDQQFTRLNNKIDQTVYEFDKTYGITNKVADSIGYLIDNFETLAQTAGIAGTAVFAALSGRLLSSAGKGVGGMFTKPFKEAQEEVKRLQDVLKANEAQQVGVINKIAQTELESNEKIVKMRLSQTKALEAARGGELAAMQKVNDLENERTGLVDRLSQARSGIVASIRMEQQESLKALKTQQLMYNNAARSFAASPSAGSLDKQINEYGKLQAAREKYEATKVRTAAASAGEFDADALKRYGSELNSINRDIATNHRAQISAGRELVKAQENYVAAQNMSPAIIEKTRKELERTKRVLSDLTKQSEDLRAVHIQTVDAIEAARKKTTVLGAAFSRLKNFGAGIWNLLGGGPGVALAGGIAAIGYMATAAANAAEKSRTLREELVEMGYIGKDVADAYNGVAKSLKDMTSDEILVKLSDIRSEIEKMTSGQPWYERLFANDPNNLGNIRDVMERISRSSYSGEDPQSQFGKAMVDVIDRFNKALAEGHGDIQGIMADLDKIGKMPLDASMLRYVGQARLGMQITAATAKLQQDVIDKSLQGGDPAALKEAQENAQKLKDELVSVVRETAGFVGITDSVGGIVDEFDNGNLTVEQFNAKLEDMRGKGTVFDLLYKKVQGLVGQLEDANGKVAEFAKKFVPDVALPNGFDRPFEMDDQIAKIRKAWDEFNKEGSKESGLTAQQKEIEKRADSIIKKAIKEGVITKDNALAYKAEAEEIAKKQIATERTVKIAEGLKDLRLDALAGGMDEWNQKIVQAARSLGVTREELEAYINAVTSGDLSKVPAVFKDIAAAMEQAAHNNLLKSLKETRLDVDSIGLSELDKQLVEIAKSSGMSYENVKRLIDALQSGNADGLTNDLKDLRTELENLAVSKAMDDILFKRSLFGLTDEEKEIRTTLHDIGLEYSSSSGQMIAQNLRLNQQYDKMEDELKKVGDAAKDAFSTIVESLFEAGDLGDKLISTFANLGKAFAKIGAEKLFDFATGKNSSLFGGISGTPSVGGGASVANYRVSGQAIGETIAPPIVDSLNSGLDTYAAAIRKIESGSYAGNYGAAGPVVTSGMYAGDRAYGAYQVMGNNIASWTKEVLGQSMTISQFLGDKMAQDKVFYAKFGQSVDKYGSVADAISVWFSGRPLSRAGNASDGYNTVPAYVSKVQSAADAYPGGLAKAVSDGTVDASKRIRVGNNFQDTYDVAPGSVAGQGGMTKMQGLLGVGGAAIGAFAGGYQSGDPISGAIGGAMAGLGATSSLSALGLGAAAGPVGIIGGAIIGLIGGLIGKSKQKKQELKQAQQELESQIGAITQLIATATGNFMGSFEKQFSSTTDEIQKAIALAEKAGNKVLAEKLKSSMETFFERLTDQWESGFQGVLASMNAGLGFDGEFIKGSDAVEKMRESLVGFVNDAKFFAEANGDLSGMLDARKREMGIGTQQQTLYRYRPEYREGGREGSLVPNELVDGYLDIANQMVDLGVQAFTSAGGQLYPTLEALKRAAIDAGLAIDEQGKVTRELKAANDNLADSVEAAREAAINTALALLSGGKEFTDIEKAIQRLEGAAASLPSLLADLGVAAEDAAKAIEHHLNVALRDLRNNLASDIQRSINDLSGFGFLNDFIDAQSAYETRVRNLRALGMDTGIALRELGLRLSNIAHEADLTDDQLKQLASVFPQLGSSFLGLMGTSLGTPQQALDDAKAKVEEARDALRESFEKEISTVEQAKSAHEDYTKSIKKFLEDLRLDNELSPLDPTERFREAQRQYYETTQAALNGNEDAISKVEDVSRQYLEEARAYYGTSEGYFSIFNDVEATLSKVLSSSEDHLTELEQQLAALEAQRDAQLGTTDAVLSVEEAINRLAEATAAQAAAQAAYDAAQDQAFQQMLELLKQTGQAYDPFITSLYRDVLGRAPDAEGAAYYTNMLNSGMSQDAVRAQFVANAQPELERGYATPLYADGGFHGGGLRIVGERGPELEATGPSRIWSASETSKILSRAWQPPNFSASNDNSMIRGIEMLASEISSLKDEIRIVADAVNFGTQVYRETANETTEAVRGQVKITERLSLRRTANWDG